jgi:hemolysin type calcium-binding protein
MSSVKAIAAAALAAGFLSASGSASAATVEDTATEGPDSIDLIVFEAGRGERNRLTIGDSRKGVVLVDHGARIRNSGGGFGACKFSRDRHRAVCDVDPQSQSFIIDLGDRNDVVRFKGVNAGRLGLSARTEVSDAALLGDYYDGLDEVVFDHGLIVGGAGNDVLRGTDQDDYLDGGRGRDVVDGGSGPDTIVNEPDGAKDRLFGGRGIDTIHALASRPLTIDLASRVFVAGAEVDSLNSLERARGGAGDDVLAGTSGSDGLFGESGSDQLNGRRGNDYLGGDLVGIRGEPGIDVLVGGAGRDLLDGREGNHADARTPTDQLNCGDDRDRIVARQDDLADPSCELSENGRFTGDLYYSQFFAADPLSEVSPVARGADGAPTYAIGCPAERDAAAPCRGRVQLERPPVTGTDTSPEVLGAGEFTIPTGKKANVPVTLNAAGKAAIAQPRARISVHVLFDPNLDFGWQQVLGP